MTDTTPATDVLMTRRKALEANIEQTLQARYVLEQRLDENMRIEAEILAEIDGIETALTALAPIEVAA